jgi:2-C-methyl-D-erythritol 4-phosphate cytidylyltransferase
MAAGRGARFGGEPKQYVVLGDRPMLVWSLQRFQANDRIDRITVVCADGEEGRTRDLVQLFNIAKARDVVVGGDTRQASVHAGLQSLPDDSECVLIHDAARPGMSEALLDRILEALATKDAVVPAMPAVDTMMVARNGAGDALIDRKDVVAVQTPQAFKTALIVRAHRDAAAADYASSDDGSLVLRLGEKLHIVEGERANLKVTHEEDLAILRALQDG